MSALAARGDTRAELPRLSERARAPPLPRYWQPKADEGSAGAMARVNSLQADISGLEGRLFQVRDPTSK